MENNNKSIEKSAKEFWLPKLESFSSPTSFVVENTNKNKKFISLSKEFAFDLSFDELIKTSLQSKNHSIEAIIASVWGLVLSRYSVEEDVLFGVNVNASSDNSENIIPVPINVNFDLCSRELLTNVEGLFAEFNSDFILQDNLYHSLTNIPDSEPLFESVIIIKSHAQNINNELKIACPLILDFDLTNKSKINIHYNSSRFSNETIDRLFGHLEVVFNALLSNPEGSLRNICILKDDEKEKVVNTWNETNVKYPDDKCLHHLFEIQVDKNNDSIAAIYENDSLTYHELNIKANQLANYLVSKGAKPGKLIAISLNRGLDMVVAMMAVSKSGAAYVPLDPTYPDDRLAYMMSDTCAPILITQSELINGFPEHSAFVVCIDTDWSKIEKLENTNLNVNVSHADLAYVIYTSGSTGRPKGAVLNHQGRVNNFCDFNRRYNIGSGDKILGLASISFDMSAYDVFGTLACGGCIVIADSTNTQGAANWSKLMVQHEITIWHSVPALMEMLVDYVEERPESSPNELRLVLLGGDWIPVALPDRLKNIVPTVQVVSMGGATECSMDSTIYDINEPSSNWKSIPYGFPMANQRTYILDENLQPVPIGVAGELHLGGVGVGEGYLNREELTAEKFIINPFIRNEKLYKTGDLARFNEDGNLELLGRIDFQVKIRGFRIELGEIESSLRQHDAVKECVILAKMDANNVKRLIAYVLPNNEYQDSDVDETEEAQVEQWQSVYDSAYSKAGELEDETFNIVSWDSSYTSTPYPEEVMRTWVNSTVERISKYKPERVLEIGCGTGLLLLRIAPSCKHYLGTDISPVALQHVEQQKKKLGLTQIELQKRSGEDFSAIENSFYDSVVLNSIVMDFPNLDYLTEVISGAVKVIKPGGVFFIGDVRDLNSLMAFHTSIEVFKSRSSSNLSELKHKINRQISVEEEMLIEPAYFATLAHCLPEISGFNIQLKRGKNNNEMTKFRYDVSFFIESDNIEQITSWYDWQTNDELSTIKKLLNGKIESPIAIRNIPNIRNADDYLAIDLLDNSHAETVSQLRKEIKSAKKNYSGIEPEKLWTIADELGIKLDILYPSNNDPEYFDAVFKPADYSKHIATAFNQALNDNLIEYANNPLQSKIRRKIVTKLRKYLDSKLPAYMVPSAFIVMDKFPLSPNGKLNRKALPEPDNLRPDLEQDYIAPRNDVEKVLSEIWSQCLNVEQVGVDDHFISLGGNSLSATQVISRIRDLFQVELPISYGFNSTVAELSIKLDDVGNENNFNIHETASVYLQVSNMSESEMQEMLN